MNQRQGEKKEEREELLPPPRTLPTPKGCLDIAEGSMLGLSHFKVECESF